MLLLGSNSFYLNVSFFSALFVTERLIIDLKLRLTIRNKNTGRALLWLNGGKNLRGLTRNPRKKKKIPRRGYNPGKSRKTGKLASMGRVNTGKMNGLNEHFPIPCKPNIERV